MTVVKCIKCMNSKDNFIVHISEGELIDHSSRKKVENEFVRSSEYEVFYQLSAKKEHLHCTCNCCDYDWRQNIEVAEPTDKKIYTLNDLRDAYISGHEVWDDVDNSFNEYMKEQHSS